jgi:hypothetical protein
MSDNQVMTQYVIYHDTTDHPGKYVVRKWTVGPDGAKPDDLAQVCDTLPLARDVVAYHFPGAFRLDRNLEDDPVIVETWV